MSSPMYSDNSPCKRNEPVPSTSRTAKDDEAKNKRMAVMGTVFRSSNLRENSENDRQPSTSNASPSKPKVNEMTICGVDLVLPVKPYKCQIAVISKVITAIKESKNCLVESPTGTGKTLALLCATLAWQQQEKKRLIKQKEDDAVLRNPDLNKTLNSSATNMASPQKNISESEIQFVKPIHGEKSIYDVPIEECSFSYAEKPKKLIHDLNESDGLVGITKKIRVSEASSFYPDSPQEAKKLNQSTDKDVTQDNIYNQTLLNNLQEQISMIIDCSLPVIYYGARTHKQLEQVVQEFKRTEYAKASPMTILSSRDFSCIKTLDKKLWPSRNDMCRSCTKSSTTGTNNESNCIYYSNYKALKHSTLPPVFDLKQLISEGKRVDACPYYAARRMGTVAQIIFCPYNYLIEPSIRKSMQIDLQNNIVIIDEGHNIEDVCREAASFTFSQDEIEHALKELDMALSYRFANQDVLNYISYLHVVLKEWSTWFLNQKPLIEKQPVNDSTAEYVWEVKNFVESLHNHNIGQKNYPDFSNNAKIFCKKLRDDSRVLMGINQATGSLIENLDTVFGYLFRNSGRCIDDYKPVMVSKLRSELTGRSKSNFKVDQTECLSLSMECLNPGVVFVELRAARCVLLASGTLTPMYSLPSELGTAFPYTVSPKHVLEDDRVWVGSLGGRNLQCDSEATRSPEVQDQLGLVVQHVCEITPHGVLCFLPSYRLMKILYQRWRSTKMLEKLQIMKHVFTEGRTMEEHEITMNKYYKCVGTGRGALLLAVYRGKVAEGMDFKDRQARAVIAVGVPYPGQHTAVKEKMKYNDKYSKDRNLLTGREWLKVQAYRALNQAAGRVVRHACDWGAVVLVDNRYSEHEYCKRLSTWVRETLGDNHNDHSTFFRGDNSLKAFMTRMKNEG